MKVENCPKRLHNCPGSSCPEHPCWALDEHHMQKDKKKRNDERGWE